MTIDAVQVYPWQESGPPTEAALRSTLQADGLQPYSWSNSPGDVYGAHWHAYNKVIVVVRGSIIFGLPEAGRQIQLHPGDRLDLPSGVVHEAVVGPEGVLCLEAHR